LDAEIVARYQQGWPGSTTWRPVHPGPVPGVSITGGWPAPRGSGATGSRRVLVRTQRCQPDAEDLHPDRERGPA